MTRQQKAQAKRERRAARGPGFSDYGKRNAAEREKDPWLSWWRGRRKKVLANGNRGEPV